MHHPQITWLTSSTAPPSLVLPHRIISRPTPENGSDEPCKKRRKITKRAKANTIDLAKPLDGFLCFARVDVDLIFSSAIDAQSTPTATWCPPLPVSLKKIEQIEGLDAYYECEIATEEGDIIVDATFGGKSGESLNVLQRVVAIPKISQKKTAAKVLCTLASDPASGGTRFYLCARILLPDNEELLEASSYDRVLVQELGGIRSPSYVKSPWSPRDFYDSVFVPDRKSPTSSFPRIDQLKCQLYPFQQRAISWLLRREKNESLDNEPNPRLPHGFVRTTDAEGKPCFVSPFLGIMSSQEGLLQGFSEMRGGILAEEMGLGKTVEMTGLICLHRQQEAPTLDTGALPECAATLIIAPPSIIEQWKSELQALAPDLRVTTYEGLHAEKARDTAGYAAAFNEYDIILTTYSVLAREIHHSGHVPDRIFRQQKKHERRLSPLTQLKWWRVVLDEAQMIESSVSNAAKVAQLIPRHNAWCVSGTPVKKDLQDLRGLLVFLRYPPYCYSSQLWGRLVAERLDIFRQIFGTLALRHTKEQIKDDLQLPPQRRIIITVPFTQIEEQNYSTMYSQMCEELGLDQNGDPLSVDWDPNASATIESMRTWLLRLRQTCLHAEVGVRNRKALGKGRSPLRTVDEVLEVMVEQNTLKIQSEERTLLLSRARRGQMFEHAKRSREALAIWLNALKESQSLVAEARSRLKLDVTTNDKLPESSTKASEEANVEAQSGAVRQRLRSALELEHMLLFFVANAYFQIKSNEEETKPGSLDFVQLQKEEEEYYERAKLIRKEILLDAREKADAVMKVLQEKSQHQSFAAIPRCKALPARGGIESQAPLEGFEDIAAFIDKQADRIKDWRNTVTKLLSTPLVDEEDTDLQGDEYEASTQQQDKVYSYVDALRAIVSDFHDIITGQRNILTEHEMKVAVQQATAGGGHSPELLLELLHIRQELKPSAGVGSIRGVITDLREHRTNLRTLLDRGNVRAGAEVGIINDSLTIIQKLSNELLASATALGREVELFTNVMNVRLEYYRQLQHLSDTVAPYEEDLDHDAFASAVMRADETEERLRIKIAAWKSTARYLDHIRMEASRSDVDRLCIICQQGFERGVLTVCGHSFCAECLRLWRLQHRTCPTCKRRLEQDDLHQITYKPQEMTVREEMQTADRPSTPAPGGGSPSIYTEISTSTLNEIKDIDLDVKKSFGTKIDTIARNIVWLREHDPGSKSIVFSQFRDFLSILSTAFASFKIGHASIDQRNGIPRFKTDPGIECLLMHAKSNASGLTLVNATHVFLCEPLINTAIELQAVARVHRIGQYLPTTVWIYVVEKTVEKSIYDISKERRVAHMSAHEYRKASGGTEAVDVIQEQIEAANTMEVEGAALGKLLTSSSSGGEVVNKDDLWNCLFRHRPVQTQAVSPRVEQEVGRHLRAAAAEERRDHDGS
ncbi:MAG: hypothetical protein LQ350_003509 [Teloschistes chrysophthalmus]|nr:MAG: hypothetical protein LQ350_003509 [Niorma chrysophthalma]